MKNTNYEASILQHASDSYYPQNSTRILPLSTTGLPVFFKLLPLNEVSEAGTAASVIESFDISFEKCGSS
jgi:hypothetical protein